MSRELTVPEPYELTLDAPGKNALSTALMRHIVDEVRSAAGRPILITGAGDTFSAGLNLKEVAGLDCPGMEDFLGLLDDVIDALYGHDAPTVACVNGHAIAGGCVLAAACDVRLMSRGTIGLAELSVGVPFPPVALEIMRHAAGPAVSRLVLTAELLDPARAQSIGLVQHVCEADVLLDSAVGQARQLARIPADVFSFSKRQLQQPARDRIAAPGGDEEAVTAMWSADRTRDAIARYLAALRDRAR